MSMVLGRPLGRLRREGSEGKVLRIDRPAAGGFLSLTAFQAEGCGIALTGDEYKVSVTDSPFCVIWHDKHSAELSAFGRYTPYPAAPDCPPQAGAE